MSGHPRTVKSDMQDQQRGRVKVKHRHGRVVEKLCPLWVARLLGQKHVERLLREITCRPLADAFQHSTHPLAKVRTELHVWQTVECFHIRRQRLG